MRMTWNRALALGLACTLAACSGSDSADQMDLPDNGMADNSVVDTMGNETTLANDADIAPPAPTASPTATPSPKPTSADKDFTDPDQVQLDAESVGMTSRVDRSGAAPTPAPSATAPTE